MIRILTAPLNALTLLQSAKAVEPLDPRSHSEVYAVYAAVAQVVELATSDSLD